jgi:hypothetical protein
MRLHLEVVPIQGSLCAGSPSCTSKPLAARAGCVRVRRRSRDIASIGWKPGCQCTTSLEVIRVPGHERGKVSEERGAARRQQPDKALAAALRFLAHPVVTRAFCKRVAGGASGHDEPVAAPRCTGTKVVRRHRQPKATPRTGSYGRTARWCLCA